MSKEDEVELGGGGSAGEDYEVVPVGPIRKLERRIDELQEQKSSGNDELVRDVLDIMKSNQKIVNDMTESTHELKNSVEDLTHKMDEVVDNMNSFMDLLEQASEADLEGEVMKDVHSKIADAIGNEMEDVASDIKESNTQVIQNLEDLNENIRRSYTSQNKSEILSQQGNSGGMNVERGKKSQRGGQNSGQRSGNQNGSGMSQGMDIDRDQSRGQRSQSNEGSDRMRKLRKRFDNMEDEE
ncbi:MAG: hypothetical protein ABEJ56_04825 [Candidatus Nanohaloarchaea archaeon]